LQISINIGIRRRTQVGGLLIVGCVGVAGESLIFPLKQELNDCGNLFQGIFGKTKEFRSSCQGICDLAVRKR
jgi:hypothetical protein